MRDVTKEVEALLGKSDRIDISLSDPKCAELIGVIRKAEVRLELTRKNIVVDFPLGGKVMTISRHWMAKPAPATPAAAAISAAPEVPKSKGKRSRHTYIAPAIANDLIAVLADEASHVVWLTGPTQCGKAQPYDAEIQTPNGPTKMGDLIVGSAVLGGNGRPCKVMGIFEQGIRPVYRVEFEDGEVSTECDLNHNWKYLRRGRMNFNSSLKSGKSRSNSNFEKWEVLTLEEIIEAQGMSNGSETATKRGCVPICGPAEFSGKVPRLVTPYVLGVLLGDGSLSVKSNILISSSDREIIDRVSKELPTGFELMHCSKYDYRIRSKTQLSGCGGNGMFGPFKMEIKRLGLLGSNCFTKFIPNEYKFVDSRSRLDLLRGLMDTDGTIGKVSRMEFCTTSGKLALDVAWLVRSLGGKCKITSRNTHYSYKGEKRTGALSYRLAVKMMENPFFLSRKARKFYPIHRRKDRILHRVVQAGEKQCRCIMVDSPDQTYLTDNFIVTHNTTLVRYVAGKMGRKLYQINCRGDMGSEAFFGEKTITVDSATKQNVISFQVGTIEQAMKEGLDAQGNEVGEPSILFIDEAATMPAHVAIGVNRLLESDDPRRTLVINEDGGRIVRSHSKFRIVLAANTVGRGAVSSEAAAYTAQMDALDISLLNRVAVTFRMGYDREIERRIVLEKVANDKIASLIIKFRDAIRGHLKVGKLTSPFSTKRLVDIANMYRVFGDLSKAIYYTTFEHLLPEERPIYNETAMAITGNDLMASFVAEGIDY